MLIDIQPVQGETPRITEKKLPTNSASKAVNCDFRAGNLRPIRGFSTGETVGTATKTIYKRAASWLKWDSVVDVVPSFVHNSGGRIAYTGDGYPKETNTALGTSSRRLGIDAPANALTVALSGTPGEDVLRTASYVYTRIGKWADGSVVESAQSYPTAPYDVKTGHIVTLSGFVDSTMSGVFTTHFRIYRMNSGNAGTEYQFLKDIPVGSSEWIDTISDADIGEDVLSTMGWSYPVEDLSGLVSTTHGFLVGFSGNKIYPSEVFTPYAFPVKYAMPTDSDIVAVGFNGSSVVALTKTYPYLFVGYDPGTLSAMKLNYEQACVSARSVVNVPNGVIYATPDGLFLLDASGQGRLLTDGTFRPEQWTALNPSSIFAFRYNDSYLAFFEGDTEGIEFRMGDNTLRRFSTTRPVYGGFYDAEEDVLYLVRQDAANVSREIVSFETHSELLDYTWWSKTFSFTSSITIAVALIQGDFTEGDVQLQVYCDGALASESTVSDDSLVIWEPVRGTEIMIKLTGKATVEKVFVASSAFEVFQHA
ncbi:MAG: hypothetical protein GY737_13850 [Desulfobacteraceae bacterium]|nr:hypothetical protein [Desulfobacteraceae bacterium]